MELLWPRNEELCLDNIRTDTAGMGYGQTGGNYDAQCPHCGPVL